MFTSAHDARSVANSPPLALSDQSARIVALTRLVAAAEEADSQTLAQLTAGGISLEMLERLRVMPMGDFLRLALGPCGLSITIDSNSLIAQFSSLDRLRLDRELQEYMVRHGASPNLLARLFSWSQADIRRIRKSLCPTSTVGGRPRIPEDETAVSIKSVWAELCHSTECLRSRIRELHQRYPQFSIASLELVVLPDSVPTSLASNS